MTSLGHADARARMVDTQIAARGIRDERVLAAMRRVPRERFLPADMLEFAYEDSPVPIGEEQTISQPFIVALMLEALGVSPEHKVLEVGAGSGYAAAVLCELAGEVHAIERIAPLADSARERLDTLGYGDRGHVHCGDGTLGWPAAAPFDRILVSAGGPAAPKALLDQLAIGGRLVIPVGETLRQQELVRITRTSKGTYDREQLGAVRFVPLIGTQGWKSPEVVSSRRVAASPSASTLVRECAEPIDGIDSAELGPLLERIGDARVVLLGEATHGTSEFYRMRSRITEALVSRLGFDVVAVEADWPDAARIDHYVRHEARPAPTHPVFERFPTWMWRNREASELYEWLRAHNALVAPERRVSFHGLDIYSLFTSIARVLTYLDEVDPDAATVARARYGCLTPWETDPAAYGRAATLRRYPICEKQAVAQLELMLARQRDYAVHDGDRAFDAAENARLVADAERYYRVMYRGTRESWNLRDQHMMDTLSRLLDHRGPGSKAVVWAHNSHVGDASATEMGVRGEHNIGQLCRARFGDSAYLVGFGTHTGTVAAASEWGGEMEIKRVVPSHALSYERVFHDSGAPAFFLPLRNAERPALREELMEPRLERAIGVVYRPDTELASHYFQAVLPVQFDEYVWFDETRAVAARSPEATASRADVGR